MAAPAGSAILGDQRPDHRVPLPSQPREVAPEAPVQVKVGDVWWIPESVNGYPGGKGRCCLVVALEAPPGQAAPARAHYVAGTTQPGSRPQIIVESGEAGLEQRTHFSFWWSGDLGVTTLAALGCFKGRLDSTRDGEIRAAICGSKRAALKRLVVCR